MKVKRCLLDFIGSCFLDSVSIQFTYVESYPDEGPVIELKPLEGLDDSHLESLKEFLDEKVTYSTVVVCTYAMEVKK